MTFTRKPIRYVQTLLVLLFTLGGAISASAHSFNAVMLLPETATEKPLRDELRDDLMLAFLLASEERDSHPDETSNGHLGGLDVHITFASAAGQTGQAGADIIATPLAGVGVADTNGAVTLTAPDMASKAAIALLATPADPALRPFAERFKAITGHAPGFEAKAVYVTARLIGQAVRKAGGVDDPALLMRLISP